jgi:hypothetical protein
MEKEYFYCYHCGCELINEFIPYSYTCANGDVFDCPVCKEQVVMDEENEWEE